MKKKQKEEEIIEEFEDELPEDEEDFIPDEQTEDIPSNPMALAHQITKESDVSKYHKELPREARMSFYNKTDADDVKHFARAYRDRKYIDRIIDIRTKQNDKRKTRLELMQGIESKEQLIEYFKETGHHYLINDVNDLTDEELVKVILHIKNNCRRNLFEEKIQKEKMETEQIFIEYNAEHNQPEYIDNVGNIGKIIDTSITSMGLHGNASKSSIMTIQAVKNENIEKSVEDKTRFSLLDSIKKRFS